MGSVFQRVAGGGHEITGRILSDAYGGTAVKGSDGLGYRLFTVDWCWLCL